MNLLFCFFCIYAGNESNSRSVFYLVLCVKETHNQSGMRGEGYYEKVHGESQRGCKKI